MRLYVHIILKSKTRNKDSKEKYTKCISYEFKSRYYCIIDLLHYILNYLIYFM